MSYKLDHGWFSEVNGAPVIKRDVGLPTTYYHDGRPIGVLWHYTAGCGADISGVLKARGISVTFSVDRDGHIYQYVPIGKAAWHAYDASHYYVGIEHSALPGTCDLTHPQLFASVQLSAAIVEWSRRANGFAIPLRKLEPPVSASDFAPGFLDHKDGDSTWNRNGHTDGLYSIGWSTYLLWVAAVLKPFEARARRGEKVRTKRFASLSDAMRWVRSRVSNRWIVHVRKRGPEEGL